MKTLYFAIPLFKRKEMERIIINELHCPCYKIVDNHMFFADNKHLLICMNKDFILVNVLSENVEIENKVHKAFEKRD